MGIFVIIAAIAIVVVTSPPIISSVFLLTSSIIIESISAKMMFNIMTIHNVDNLIFISMLNCAKNYNRSEALALRKRILTVCRQVV